MKKCRLYGIYTTSAPPGGTRGAWTTRLLPVLPGNPHPALSGGTGTGRNRIRRGKGGRFIYAWCCMFMHCLYHPAIRPPPEPPKPGKTPTPPNRFAHGFKTTEKQLQLYLIMQRETGQLRVTANNPVKREQTHSKFTDKDPCIRANSAHCKEQ